MTSSTISSGTTVSNTVVNGGDVLSVYGTGVDTTVNSGGTENIFSGGVASSTTVNFAATESVFGTAIGTKIIYGTQYVSTGGVTSGTSIIGADAAEAVYTGGMASNTIVGAGGTEDVWGGVAIGTTISSGGSQDVSGGVASGAVVGSSGTQSVSEGGTAVYTVIDDGGRQILVGNDLGRVGNSFSATVGSGGVEYVQGGGVASFTTILNGGTEHVDYGDARSTTVSGGGIEYIGGGGIASDTTVSNGGGQFVSASGTANGTIVSSGGSQLIYSGGTASGVLIALGGFQYVSSGTASDTTVGSSGTQFIYSGGVAIGTVVSNGGVENVSSRGVASGTALGSGGVQAVYFGGMTSGTAIGSGGTETVGSGGIARDTSISGGVLDLTAGAILSGSVTYMGVGGDLKIDGTALPTNTISALTPGDTIDLASIAFDRAGTVGLTSGNVLQVNENGNLYSLYLDPNQSFAGRVFRLDTDTGSGTLITESAPHDDYRDAYNDAGLPLGSLSVGGTATGNIDVVGDRDVFAVSLAAGARYTFNLDGYDVSSSYTLRDPALRLLDSAGNVLATNDDVSSTDWSSEIVGYVAPSTGTYYLEAASSPSDGTYTTGNYQVRASTTPDDYRDTYNYNGLPLGNLLVGGTATGKIDVVGDKDVFAVSLTAGSRYDFNLDGYDVSSSYTLRDPALRLLDSSGNVLATNDDVGSTDWSSEIVGYVAPSTGTYYLEAASSPSDGTYTTGNYQIRANTTPDDYRNTYSDASRPLGNLTIGGTAAGSVDYVGDKDIFAVTLSAGHAYTFNLDGYDVSSSYTLRDPALRLLDSSGNLLASSDDVSSANWSSEIDSYVAPLSGTYYLEAASSPIDGTYTTGSYQIRAVDPPLPQAASDASTADIITAPVGDQTLTGTAKPEVFDFTNLSFGKDTIIGFDPAHDTIQLTASLAADFAAIRSDMSATGAGTLIAFDASHSITLNGLAPASLTAANFRVV